MPNPYSPSRIEAIRQHMCLNHYNFAAAIGVDRSTLYRWEVEESEPSPGSRILLEIEESKMLRASQNEEE